MLVFVVLQQTTLTNWKTRRHETWHAHFVPPLWKCIQASCRRCQCWYIQQLVWSDSFLRPCQRFSHWKNKQIGWNCNDKERSASVWEGIKNNFSLRLFIRLVWPRTFPYFGRGHSHEGKGIFEHTYIGKEKDKINTYLQSFWRIQPKGKQLWAFCFIMHSWTQTV